jgi:uncharacterized RDD family membrane protein YckC
MNELVTGDAVVLELRPAELVSRALAFGLDVLVMGVVFIGLLIGGLLAGTGFDSALAAAVILVIVVGVFVAYPVTVETLTRGRSIGKLALGLRVVRTDGGPIRFRHALARGLAGFVVDFGVFSLFTGAVALFAALLSPRGQRVGDLLAGTIVVRERVRQHSAPPVGMPPELAGWAPALELSGLPDATALAARQFLQRAAMLDGGVRAGLGTRLAGEVAACVSPAAPPGTHPEAFLAAVVAERRRREEVRLGRAHPGL